MAGVTPEDVRRGKVAVEQSKLLNDFERDAALERRGGRHKAPKVQFATTEGALAFLLKNVPRLREDLDEQDREKGGK